MPVRSLTSSVVTWPDAHAVDTALRQWARAAADAGLPAGSRFAQTIAREAIWIYTAAP